MRWLVLLVMAGSAAGSWWLFSTTKQELAPLEDLYMRLLRREIPVFVLLTGPARFPF